MISNDSNPQVAAGASPPLPRTAPDYLATIARLRGIEPPDVEGARVLELGSAAGGNLIPMAERHPNATFVGIDSRSGLVDTAREAAAAAGIGNVEFRYHDLLKLGTNRETFDYIVVPGLYTSLDTQDRDKLLSMVRDHLSPQGVAIAAYHTYPAWHIHQMLGRMAQYDARDASTPAERVAKARMLVSVLQTALTDDNPYNALLTSEIAQLAQQDDRTFEQTYLEAGVRPVYFRQFLTDAARSGLQYLGDGVVGAGYTGFTDEDTELALGRIASDPLRQEQYRDVLHNRRFRQTLVCHAGIELATNLMPEHLEGFFLAAQLKPDDPKAPLRSGTLQRFTGISGLSVSAAVPLVQAALLHLSEIWPAYVTFEDLVAAACQRLNAAGVTSIGEPERERLRQNLVDGAVRGVIEVHAQAAPFVSQVSQRPAASPFARWQAAEGEPPTNRRHEAVWLENIDAQVLSLLDGSRDQSQLLDALVDSVRSGRLDIIEENQRVRGLEYIKPLLAATLADSLPRLAQHALLVS